MEIRQMNHDDIEQRLSEIQEELNNEDANIEELTNEVDALQERDAELKDEAEERRNVIKDVIANGNQIEERKGEKNMNIETRKAEMYDAIAEVIKGRATEEQRALLTTNAEDGTVPISEIMEDYIWTDWEKSPILSRVRKVYVKGNYSVTYEKSATGAFKHQEGTQVGADKEEELILDVIKFISAYTKKFIYVSDEVLALRGQAFLDYLFGEFGHQLALALEKDAVDEIANSALSAKVTHALDGDAVLSGLAILSDEATNPVAIMSKQTYASIKSQRTTGGARIEEPFEGLEVLFNSNVEGILVGDLDGVVANFPEGEEFKFIVDDKSMAEQDMVKIVGKIMNSVHLVRPNGFAVVTAE